MIAVSCVLSAAANSVRISALSVVAVATNAFTVVDIVESPPSHAVFSSEIVSNAVPLSINVSRRFYSVVIAAVFVARSVATFEPAMVTTGNSHVLAEV